MSSVWFIVQKKSIKTLNPRVIGFWDKKVNYDPISVGDKIIYFIGGKDIKQKGPIDNTERKETLVKRQTGNTEGIFKVTDKQNGIDPKISAEIANSHNLEWQFSIKLVNQIIINKKILDNYKGKLTFYDEWSNNQWGGGNVQIFKSSEKDITALKSILKSTWNQSMQKFYTFYKK